MGRSDSAARPTTTGASPMSARRPSVSPWITTTQAERGVGRKGPSLKAVRCVVSWSSAMCVMRLRSSVTFAVGGRR
jgi:hypothetical protein